MSKLEKSAKVAGFATLQEALNGRKVLRGVIPTLNSGTITLELKGFYNKRIFGDVNGATLSTLKGELVESANVKAFNAASKLNEDTFMPAKAVVSFSLEQCQNCSELVWEENGLNWVDKGTWSFVVLDGKITSAKETGATKTKLELKSEIKVLQAKVATLDTDDDSVEIATITTQIAALQELVKTAK